MEIRFAFVGSGVLLTALLAGCGQEAESPGTAVTTELTPVPHAAWLSRHLPAEAMAYARVPGLWDAFTEAQENALHPVQTSAAHADLIAAIRQGLHDNLVSQLPPPAQLLAEPLLRRLEGPLEVAVLKATDGSAVPNGLLAAKMAFDDAAAFAEWLSAMTDLAPELRVLTPMDADGNMTLMAGPVPVFVHFDGGEQRALMLTGMSASQPDLIRYAGSNEAESALTGFERGIDASGRGLALWLDVATLYSMYAPMMPPEQAAQFVASGLDQARFLWLGAASKGGKSSFKVHLAMPQVGFRKALARADQAPGLSTAGPAKFALRLALPSVAEVAEGLDYALSLSVDGAKIRTQLSTVKSKLDEALSFDSSLLLEAIGPEIIVVSDDAGLWAGYQIRDRGALDQVIAGIEDQSGVSISRHRAGGVDINHWALPALWSLDELQGEAEVPKLVTEMLGRIKSRLYWIEEDGYLVMAGVPQVLAARAQIGADRDLSDWLAGDLQLDWRHSVFAIATRAQHSPRDVYHGYLNALNFFADLAGAEFDPFAMPTWIDAGLPAYGRLGLRIDSGPDAIGLSLDYEYSPMEMLFAGNAMVAVGALGVGAAIAIPAYQDYRMRAQIAQGLARAAALKLPVAEYHYSLGRFPNANEAAEMGQRDDAMNLELQPDTGIISISFTGESAAPLTGRSVFLQPVIGDDGALSWICGSDDVQPRHLPASCRK